MKFDRSNKFDFCYYGQVNSLRLTKFVWNILYDSDRNNDSELRIVW